MNHRMRNTRRHLCVERRVTHARNRERKTRIEPFLRSCRQLSNDTMNAIHYCLDWNAYLFLVANCKIKLWGMTSAESPISDRWKMSSIAHRWTYFRRRIEIDRSITNWSTENQINNQNAIYNSSNVVFLSFILTMSTLGVIVLFAVRMLIEIESFYSRLILIAFISMKTHAIQFHVSTRENRIERKKK